MSLIPKPLSLFTPPRTPVCVCPGIDAEGGTSSPSVPPYTPPRARGRRELTRRAAAGVDDARPRERAAGAGRLHPRAHHPGRLAGVSRQIVLNLEPSLLGIYENTFRLCHIVKGNSYRNLTKTLMWFLNCDRCSPSVGTTSRFPRRSGRSSTCCWSPACPCAPPRPSVDVILASMFTSRTYRNRVDCCMLE